MEKISEVDRLRFYRDEIKHEFSLLAMRSTILVTCQSFLVVPYAILNTAASFRSVLVPTYIVAALGIFVALVLLGPINAAHRTIGKWLVKQRSLLKGSAGLSDLAIDRDMIPGTEKDSHRDKDHERSLLFSKIGPWAFILFWVACIVWTTVRVVLDF